MFNLLFAFFQSNFGFFNLLFIAKAELQRIENQYFHGNT